MMKSSISIDNINRDSSSRSDIVILLTMNKKALVFQKLQAIKDSKGAHSKLGF